MIASASTPGTRKSTGSPLIAPSVSIFVKNTSTPSGMANVTTRLSPRRNDSTSLTVPAPRVSAGVRRSRPSSILRGLTRSRSSGSPVRRVGPDATRFRRSAGTPLRATPRSSAARAIRTPTARDTTRRGRRRARAMAAVHLVLPLASGGGGTVGPGGRRARRVERCRRGDACARLHRGCHLGRGAPGDDVPTIDDRDAVAELLGLVEQVRGEHDRGATRRAGRGRAPRWWRVPAGPCRRWARRGTPARAGPRARTRARGAASAHRRAGATTVPARVAAARRRSSSASGCSGRRRTRRRAAAPRAGAGPGRAHPPAASRRCAGAARARSATGSRPSTRTVPASGRR